MRLPAQLPSVSSKGQPPASSGERSIVDLRKLIEDFLVKIEGSLHTPYELSKARKDYEAIAVAIKIIEKSMEDRDMLNVSDQDVAVSTKSGGKGLDELVQRAVSQKSMVDAEFQKVAAAADAAVAVIRNPSTTARREI